MPDSPEGRLSAERLAEIRRQIQSDSAHAPSLRASCPRCIALGLLAHIDAQAATIEDLTAERDRPLVCDGRCTTAADLGFHEMGDAMAYPDPACHLHGDPVAYALELERELAQAKTEIRRAAADTPKLPVADAALRWFAKFMVIGSDPHDEWVAFLKACRAAAFTEEPEGPQPTCPDCSSPIGVTENDYGDPAFCKNPIHAAVTEEPAAPSVREAFMSLTLPVFAIETMSALGWATFGEGDEDARDAALDAFIDACRRARPDLAPNYDRVAPEEPEAPPEPEHAAEYGRAYCVSCFEAWPCLAHRRGDRLRATPEATTPGDEP